MIDFSNEIFTGVCQAIWTAHGQDIEIKGEYVSAPTTFPTITIDESQNIISNLDNGVQKYADIQYRVQIFSNKPNGKRMEARALFDTIEQFFYEHNLICKTYTTTPNIYNSAVYEIQATFEGTIDSNGTIFRR